MFSEVTDLEWSYKDKKRFIIAGSVIVAAVILGMKYLFPIFAPFIAAYLIAGIIDRPAKLLSNKFGGKRTVYGAVILVMLVTVLAAAVVIVGYMGIKELRSLVANFEHNMVFVRQNVAKVSFDIDKVFGLKDGSCMSLVEGCERRIGSFMKSTDAARFIGNVVSVSVPVVKEATTIFANILACFFSVLLILPKLDNFRRWRRKSVFRREIRIVSTSLSLLVKVYFKVELMIIVINATVIALGLMFIKNPYAVVLGIFIGLIDMLPVLGTGTVLLPWSVVMLLIKQPRQAIVLLVLYVITYFVRELMESKIMGDRLGISGFAMLVIIFAGVIVYGFWGFVLGPVSYCIIKPLILYLKRVIESGKLDNI